MTKKMIRDLKREGKQGISGFKYNHRLYRLYSILVEGPGILETLSTYDSYDAIKLCRKYYGKGIETRAYLMPGRKLIIDYRNPFRIEKVYTDGIWK